MGFFVQRILLLTFIPNEATASRQDLTCNKKRTERPVRDREGVISLGNQGRLLSHKPQRRLLTTCQILQQKKGYLVQKMDRLEGILATAAPDCRGSSSE